MHQWDELTVGVDGSAASSAAVAWAATEARYRGCGLTIVHIADGYYGGVWTEARIVRAELRRLVRPIVEQARTIARSAEPAVPVRVGVLVGSPTRILLRLSASSSLVVVGRTGRSPVSQIVLGSIPQRLAASATCPIVVVNVRPESVPSGELTRVLVGIDDAGDHVAALQFAIAAAERRGAAVHVVWATGKQSSYQQALSLAEAMLTWREHHPDVPMTCEAQPGQLQDVVPPAAMPGDLLVVAHHRHDPFVPDALRSNIRSLLGVTPCPVAIVHEPQRTPVDSRLVAATSQQQRLTSLDKDSSRIGDGNRATDPVVR